MGPRERNQKERRRISENSITLWKVANSRQKQILIVKIRQTAQPKILGGDSSGCDGDDNGPLWKSDIHRCGWWCYMEARAVTFSTMAPDRFVG